MEAHGTRLNKLLAVQMDPYQTHALAVNEGPSRRPLTILRTAPGAAPAEAPEEARPGDGDDWYLQLARPQLGKPKSPAPAQKPTHPPPRKLSSVASPGDGGGGGAFTAAPKKKHLPPVCAADDDPIARELAGLIANECVAHKGSAPARTLASLTATDAVIAPSPCRSSKYFAASPSGGGDQESTALPNLSATSSTLPPLSHTPSRVGTPGGDGLDLDITRVSTGLSAGSAPAQPPARGRWASPPTPGVGRAARLATPPGTPSWNTPEDQLFTAFLGKREKPVPLAPVPPPPMVDRDAVLSRATGGFFTWLSGRQLGGVTSVEARQRAEMTEIETDLFLLWLWPMAQRLELQAYESVGRNELTAEESELRETLFHSYTIYGGVIRQTAQASHQLRYIYFMKLNVYVVIKRKALYLLQKEHKLDSTVKMQRRRWAWGKLYRNIGTQQTHRIQRTQLERTEVAERRDIYESEADWYEVFNTEVRRYGLIVWMIWQRIVACPREETARRSHIWQLQAAQMEAIAARAALSHDEVATRACAVVEFRDRELKLTKLLSLSLISEQALLGYRYLTWYRFRCAQLDMSSPEGRVRMLKKKNVRAFIKRFYAAWNASCEARRRVRRRHEKALQLLYKTNVLLFRKAWACFRKMSFRRVVERLMMRGTVLLLMRFWPKLLQFKRLAPAQKRLWDMEQLRAANLSVILGGYYRRLDAFCSRRIQQRMKVKILRYDVTRHVVHHCYQAWIGYKDRRVLKHAVDELMARSERLLLCLRWGAWQRLIYVMRRDRGIVRGVKVLLGKCRRHLRSLYYVKWQRLCTLRRQERTRLCDASLLEDQSLLIHRKLRFRLLLRHSRWQSNVTRCAAAAAAHTMNHLALRFRVWLRYTRRKQRTESLATMAAILEADSHTALLARYYTAFRAWATDPRSRRALQLLRMNKAVLARRYFTTLRRFCDWRDVRAMQRDDAVLLAGLHSQRLLRRYWALLFRHARWLP